MKLQKNILITGGLGYIGSHAVVGFYEAGFTPIIVDNCSNSNQEVLSRIEKIIGFKPEFYEIDLRDKDNLEKIFETHCIDGVVHFAGLKAVGESCEKPLEYFDNNIIGSLRLFECMQSFGVKNIIFSSSATVYDFDNPIPYVETFPIGKTTNPYANSKFIIEKILQDLANFQGFHVLSLRYFNPIGAHQSGFIGENPNGIPNNLLPYILKVASGELPFLQIYGTDYHTRDGTGVRDYVDVNDLIEGHVLGYKYLENAISENFTAVNLGVGKGISVFEFLDCFEKISGISLEKKICPRRQGDVAEFYCNPEKAKNLFGWEAHTSLEESLKNIWKFYKK